jgi:hypothetical protein
MDSRKADLFFAFTKCDLKRPFMHISKDSGIKLYPYSLTIKPIS